MIEYFKMVGDLKMKALTEKEEAILLLGLGGNDVKSIHYEILDNGVRQCFTDNGSGGYSDWSPEFTLAYAGDGVWEKHFHSTVEE